MPLDPQFLSQMNYPDSLVLMDNLRDMVTEDLKPRIMGLEYDRLVTLGRRIDIKTYPKLPGYQYFSADRGGEATLHNKGQLVIYPIINLREQGLGVRDFVCLLETSSIKFFTSLGLEAFRDAASGPGLYSGGGKIMSLGVRVKRGVSTHGIAININNDLRDFVPIECCGISSPKVDKLATYGEFDLQDCLKRWSDIFYLELDNWHS